MHMAQHVTEKKGEKTTTKPQVKGTKNTRDNHDITMG